MAATYSRYTPHRGTASSGSLVRDGKNVQHMLPQLATYLGHRDIGSVQRYIHMTPELLHEASRRFERYAQGLSRQ